MALYLLSYDITKKDDDYESLWNFLKGCGAKRILYSEWVVPWDSAASAIDLVKAAIEHLMADDQVFVCELFENSSCAWRGLRITSEEFKGMLTDYARASG